MPDIQTLTVTLPSDLEIRMVRTFRAPKARVFEAHIRPEHLRRWWGGKSAMTVCEVDARVGGRYRFVCQGPDGAEHGFRGEYREIAPPDRLSYTFEYEGMPGHISTETLTFVEENGVTTLIDETVFASKEDRDGMLESGMEAGANDSMDRLEDVLAELG